MFSSPSAQSWKLYDRGLRFEDRQLRGIMSRMLSEGPKHLNVSKHRRQGRIAHKPLPNRFGVLVVDELSRPFSAEVGGPHACTYDTYMIWGCVQVE